METIKKNVITLAVATCHLPFIKNTQDNGIFIRGMSDLRLADACICDGEKSSKFIQ